MGRTCLLLTLTALLTGSSPGGTAAGRVAVQGTPFSTLVRLGRLPLLGEGRWAQLVESQLLPPAGGGAGFGAPPAGALQENPFTPSSLPFPGWVSYKMLEAVLEADVCASRRCSRTPAARAGHVSCTCGLALAGSGGAPPAAGCPPGCTHLCRGLQQPGRLAGQFWLRMQLWVSARVCPCHCRQGARKQCICLLAAPISAHKRPPL